MNAVRILAATPGWPLRVRARGLSDAPRPSHRQQANVGVAEHGPDLLEVAGTSDEEGSRRWQVRAIRRPQRREVDLADLEQPLRLWEILQPVHAEVADVRVDKVASRLREQDLTAVAGGRYPRRLMNIQTDVPILGEHRLAVMHPYAHTGRPRCERFLRGCSAGHGVGSLCEHEEDCVPLRIDLNSAVLPEGSSQHPAMLGKRFDIPLAQLAQEQCRPFDIGKHERNGARG